MLIKRSVSVKITWVGSSGYYVTREPETSSEAGKRKSLKSVTTFWKRKRYGDNIVRGVRPHGQTTMHITQSSMTKKNNHVILPRTCSIERI